MYIFAYACLLAGLLCTLGGAGLSLMQLWERRQNQVSLITSINWIASLSLLLASAILLHALFWEDYRLEYVSSYTDSILPVFYRLTAFWAGQPGSMLFWALVTSISGTLCAITPSFARQSAQTRLWFWLLFYAIMAFFFLVLTCWSNPFILQQPVPVDGNGLNPLLQNPGMIFHPPLLFIGYAGFTVPACLGLAQLLAQPTQSASWFSVTRPWFILSWITLTAGIVLGAWWAYMELGWGGYWAWDPVENASLLPWLTGTAALHLMLIDRRFGKLNRACVFLLGLTVVAAFFATYLTRSGVIQSVHAFGDGGVGTPLTVFVVFALFVLIYMVLGAPARSGEMAAPVSREGAIVLLVWLLLALTLIILLGTMWPVISKLWGAMSQGLDAAFYNRVCLPVACGILLLLCLCFCLGWQDGIKKHAFLYAIGGVFLASCGVIWYAGYRQPLALISAAAAIAAICAAVLLLFSKTAWHNPSRVAALGAHLGLGLAALGVAFSGPYTVERDLVLKKGESGLVGPYTVILENIQDGAGPGYDYLRATLKLMRDREEVGILMPERRIYEKFGDMQFSEVDVISGFSQDIYASLLGMDEEAHVLTRVSLEPLVNWIWIGGAIMCLAPLADLWRRKGSA